MMRNFKFVIALLCVLAGGCSFYIQDTPELRSRMGEEVLEVPPLPTEEPCFWIKGNVNAKGEKIYHMEGQANYTNTIPEVEFCTEEEAVEAGFRKAQR